MKYYIHKNKEGGTISYADKSSSVVNAYCFSSEFDLLKLLGRISLALGDRVKTVKITNSEGYEYSLDKYSPAIHGI